LVCFIFDVTSLLEDAVFIGKVKTSISPSGKTAKMIFYNLDNQEIKSKSLIIKIYDEFQTALFE